MTRRTNPSVHVFSLKGIDFAYDGSSGCLHVLDGLGKAVLLWAMDNPGSWDVADAEPGAPPERLACHLAGRFGFAQVKAAWQEFLASAGRTIFCSDDVLSACRQTEEVSQAAKAGIKSMCLDVAHDCNLACKYCFASTGNFGGTPCLMTPKTGKAAIDFLLDASRDRRFLDVDFFGGEPLLAFDTVKTVLNHARDEGAKRGKEFRFTLTTNCTLLTEEKASYLDDNGVSLILSLDGRPETHNRMRPFRGGLPSHEIAVKNALAAAKSRSGGGYCIVRGTYTKANLDFDEDVRYLYDKGFRHISLEPAVGEKGDLWAVTRRDLSQAREAYAGLVDFWADRAAMGDPFEFYHFELGLEHGLCRERRVTGCGAGYEYIAVTPEGHIYPCHQLVGQSEYLMGDIREGIRRKDLVEKFCGSRVPFKPDCVSCWARYLCGGGCHARAISASGDLLKPDPTSCEIMKSRLEYALLAQYLRQKQRDK